jgi:hypothetical protein
MVQIGQRIRISTQQAAFMPNFFTMVCNSWVIW